MKLLISIWLKMSFCVTTKGEINALQGYSTFSTDKSITCLRMWIPTFIIHFVLMALRR